MEAPLSLPSSPVSVRPLHLLLLLILTIAILTLLLFSYGAFPSGSILTINYVWISVNSSSCLDLCLFASHGQEKPTWRSTAQNVDSPSLFQSISCPAEKHLCLVLRQLCPPPPAPALLGKGSLSKFVTSDFQCHLCHLFLSSTMAVSSSTDQLIFLAPLWWRSLTQVQNLDGNIFSQKWEPWQPGLAAW